ncbi:CrcB family protein [Amycolatopsis sp. 195334CR]|uniref:fluoride efflux transporter FluC n=1 Tax=Amycolatopsis sp. 195334CR TaxID=2814588 RepID=UPI001A8CDA56|nr:CrcB family protein [Amycolatopsis sp. 195334CR]MBN6042182.1 CrcB family protein [Amycolatopsis sp. 195334CR]
MNWLMVILGALAGAPLRYLIDRAVRTRHGGTLPWGTFVVNLLACAGLGFLTGATAAVPVAVQHLLGPGLCATLSTYSTFSAETLRLARTGGTLIAAGKAIASVLIGLTAAGLSSALGQALLT